MKVKMKIKIIVIGRMNVIWIYTMNTPILIYIIYFQIKVQEKDNTI